MNTPILAFAMPGGPEILFIFLIIILIFGAKKLPELARGIGQSLGEFKRGREEFERESPKSSADKSSNQKPDNNPQNPA